MADDKTPAKPPPIIVEGHQDGTVTVDGKPVPWDEVLKHVAEEQAKRTSGNA